jgi:hypothetical protein
LSKKDQPKNILLKDIQRGNEFCLIANIEVDGEDLCELLVKNKLAKKIIQVPSGTPDVSTGQSGDEGSAASIADIENAQFIASKSSKVYHRSTCPHVKRMDRSKAVVFSGRSEAENTGRRACKTCKP